MERLGIATGLDLRAQTLEFLQRHFGKVGAYYYWASRGIDERPVVANRIRKSIGAENTFPADLHTYEAARETLNEIADKVWRYCEGSGVRGRTVTLKVKFANFGRSPEAVPATTRSAAAMSSGRSATPCSNLFSRSRAASAFSGFRCLRSGPRRSNPKPSSTSRSEREAQPGRDT